MSYFSRVINTDYILKALFDGNVHYGVHEFTDVADADGAEFLIQVGAERILAIMDVTVEATSTADLYEGPTFSAAGTGVTLYNMDRSSANTSNVTLTHTPTITNDGTLLEVERIFEGGTMVFGADKPNKAFWILDANTNYLLQSGNVSGGPEDIIMTVALIDLP